MIEEKIESAKAVLEAMFFASNRPVSKGTLRAVLSEFSETEIEGALAALREEYDSSGRGVRLIEIAGGYQVVSKEEFAAWVERLMKGTRKARLSKPALETVAVVAYRQPVTRAGIEQIRGVDVASVLATLLERGLIAVKGRAHGVGRPLLYGTTQQFLTYFRLNDLSELPRLEELEILLESRESQAEELGELGTGEAQ
ncbi:MAG: SMC-Scp complex subunit ScpB [Candidatus Eisenbacteria bacterium]|nr:SMC-Scp complex subunit ScpB [Candidatus Eisenbacteria bacterium]